MKFGKLTMYKYQASNHCTMVSADHYNILIWYRGQAVPDASSVKLRS